MRIVAVVQARMGSTRLPGKVLLPLAGTAVIDHVLARINRAGSFDTVAVATSDLPQDDVLTQHVEALGMPVVRGSESNVLSRYLKAAEMLHADYVMRITADCPLIEPALLREMVDGVRLEPVDLVTNARVRTYPRGLDAELVRVEALYEAARQADAEDREHVTRYIYRNAHQFSLRDMVSNQDHSELRWTLDEDADYTLLERIFSTYFRGGIGRAGGGPFLADILALYEQHPEWLQINAHIQQKPGLPGKSNTGR